MQCHNCPKSLSNGGTPDESCLTCKCAEYLDNDHKTVIPTDDVSALYSHIEPSYGTNGSESAVHKNTEVNERNREDCKNAINFFKKCHHSSFKHIACLLAAFMMAGSGAPILGAALDGKTMAEYAASEGCTRQNASQRWNKMVKEIPLLAEIVKSSSKKAKKRATFRDKE